MSTSELIYAGEITGVFGLRGWVKVFSNTSPRENILNYSPWWLKKEGETRQVKLLAGHRQGKGVVVSLENLSDRNIAEKYLGWAIWIERGQLPSLPEDEYYWVDLIGLQVKNHQGVMLGQVDSLIETGANDVLVVKDHQQQRERLIPFVQGQFVKTIDLESKLITVDWDLDF